MRLPASVSISCSVEQPLYFIDNWNRVWNRHHRTTYVDFNLDLYDWFYDWLLQSRSRPLWTLVAKYIKWPFSALTEQKPLNRSKQQFAQLITSAGPPSRLTFHNDRPGDRGSPYTWSLRLAEFFLWWLVGQAHSRLRTLESHILYINRRGFSQGCAIWGPHRYFSSQRGVIPQNFSFWGRQWGFPA
jgi:hypothetical protein